jgi:hypothetical protein
VKIVRRYLFTFLLLLLAFLSVLGWWHSSREWSAWVAETPYGVFKIQSESSIFGIGGQFMKHEHRWAAYSNADSISGDHMRWIVKPPDFRLGNGMCLVILPYWEVLMALLFCAVSSFLCEKGRVKKECNPLE